MNLIMYDELCHLMLKYRKECIVSFMIDFLQKVIFIFNFSYTVISRQIYKSKDLKSILNGYHLTLILIYLMHNFIFHFLLFLVRKMISISLLILSHPIVKVHVILILPF